jgi:hypothetical protein
MIYVALAVSCLFSLLALGVSLLVAGVVGNLKIKTEVREVITINPDPIYPTLEATRYHHYLDGIKGNVN